MFQKSIQYLKTERKVPYFKGHSTPVIRLKKRFILERDNDGTKLTIIKGVRIFNLKAWIEFPDFHQACQTSDNMTYNFLILISCKMPVNYSTSVSFTMGWHCKPVSVNIFYFRPYPYRKLNILNLLLGLKLIFETIITLIWDWTNQSLSLSYKIRLNVLIRTGVFRKIWKSCKYPFNVSEMSGHKTLSLIHSLMAQMYSFNKRS